MTITVTYGPLDATDHGRFSDDGSVFSGGWRPNPGADPMVNVAYDVSGSRVGQDQASATPTFASVSTRNAQ